MLLEKLAEQDFRYSLDEDFISPISCIIIFFFWPHHSGMWDLSYPTSDQTHTPPAVGGLRGKSPCIFFYLKRTKIINRDTCSS